MEDEYGATLALLEGARSYLADRDHWTKGAFARDTWGRDMSFDDPKATSRCLLGTLLWLGRPSRRFEHAWNALSDALLTMRVPPTIAIGDWQDQPSRTHDEMLNLLDRAIARIRERDTPASAEGIGG